MSDSASFEAFFRATEAGVRFALTASLGSDLGREAAAEGFAYAWQHWERIRQIENPAGFVFRVGLRKGRRMRPRTRIPVYATGSEDPREHYEPRLVWALGRLSRRQREAVLLVHGAGWSYRQAAALLSVTPATVQAHVRRGLIKLRADLGVDNVGP